jgi:HK97 gp10 family phage protein
MAATFHIDGLDNAVKALAALPRKIRNKSLRKSFSKGATVCAKAVRRNTRRDTGTAKKNVGTKVVVKGDKDPVAFAGHKRIKGQKGGKNPAKYSHLMELGARSHVITPKRAKSIRFSVGKGKKAGFVFARRINHPGAPAQHVIRRSFSESRSQATTVITESLRASIPGDVR